MDKGKEAYASRVLEIFSVLLDKEHYEQLGCERSGERLLNILEISKEGMNYKEGKLTDYYFSSGIRVGMEESRKLLQHCMDMEAKDDKTN